MQIRWLPLPSVPQSWCSIYSLTAGTGQLHQVTPHQSGIAQSVWKIPTPPFAMGESSGQDQHQPLGNSAILPGNSSLIAKSSWLQAVSAAAHCCKRTPIFDISHCLWYLSAGWLLSNFMVLLSFFLRHWWWLKSMSRVWSDMGT